MKIFGLVGWSGSGKTTLVAKLVPELIGRGFTLSTMKHMKTRRPALITKRPRF